MINLILSINALILVILLIYTVISRTSLIKKLNNTERENKKFVVNLLKRVNKNG